MLKSASQSTTCLGTLVKSYCICDKISAYKRADIKGQRISAYKRARLSTLKHTLPCSFLRLNCNHHNSVWEYTADPKLWEHSLRLVEIGLTNTVGYASPRHISRWQCGHWWLDLTVFWPYLTLPWSSISIASWVTSDMVRAHNDWSIFCFVWAHFNV